MLEPIIENIGLTKKEARVYLAALEIGSNPVSKIAQKARINRVTAYDIMEKLAKRGLVTSFTRAKVKYYTAADPELVANDFKKKVEELDAILPQLKQLSGEVVKPKVMSYESLEAIKKIYKDVLSTENEILMYSNIKDIETHWTTFSEDFERKRMDYEISLRLIAVDNERGNFYKEYDDEFQRKTRLASKEHFDFSSHTIIYDNKVALISFTGPIGVVIEDANLAATYRALFAMNWSSFEKESPTMVVRKVGKLKKEKVTQEIPIQAQDQNSLF